ncbi:hypothetical protein ABLE68_17190 [Nocardioides sp. CN2-186]|uniref:hypothetical protein n=1 Tax=Nocardioides tweenelious TaxID=3156607 RepID=UPI0032B47B68
MPTTRARAPWIGLVVALVLVLAAFAVPPLLGWEVWARAPRSLDTGELPPLHGYWDPKLADLGTLAAIVLALLGWRFALAYAERLPWRRLLLTSYAVALAWMLALAFVDGTSGISRVLGDPYEYLRSAREVTSVHTLLSTYVDRIPMSAPDNWPTHPAGHPPGALLFFVGLVKVGLGGDFVAGLVVTVLAATTVVAVLVTLRALDAEAIARRAVPFLVFAPAAVFMAVSGDALFGAVVAWALACLAIGATSVSRGRMVAWSALSGLLFGSAVMMSYGLPLAGLLALAVLVLARSWLPLPIAAVAALAVVLAFAVGGFSWWEAYPVLNDRYWDGIAADRPASYWMWGNLAALLVCAGPLLGAGLAQLVALGRRADRVVLWLVSAAAAAIVLADVSRMSKAEVERIWLPFVPWLMLSTALLPKRWRKWGLALQLVSALLVQQLLYTSW